MIPSAVVKSLLLGLLLIPVSRTEARLSPVNGQEAWKDSLAERKETANLTAAQSAGASRPDSGGLPGNADILIVTDCGEAGRRTLFGEFYANRVAWEIAQSTFHAMDSLPYRMVLNRNGERIPDSAASQPANGTADRQKTAKGRPYAGTPPRVCLVLRVNGDADPFFHGPQVFYQNNDLSRLLGHYLQYYLNKAYPSSKLPVPGSVRPFPKQTDCPAVVIEMGSLSDPKDRSRLTDLHKQKEIAEAIRTAIDEYIKLIKDLR